MVLLEKLVVPQLVKNFPAPYTVLCCHVIFLCNPDFYFADILGFAQHHLGQRLGERRLLASSRLSVCPHGTTRLPLDGISYLIFEDFPKKCRDNSTFIKI